MPPAGRHGGWGVFFDDSRSRGGEFSRQNFTVDPEQCLDVRASFWHPDSLRALMPGLARAASS